MRYVKDEINYLIKNLGLSDAEAYDALGLKPPGEEPLLQEKNLHEENLQEHNLQEQHLSVEQQQQLMEDTVKEMFPDVPNSAIKEALDEGHNDIDIVSELLLNRELILAEEGNNKPDRNWVKRVKKMQKERRKEQRMLQTEEQDIDAIVSAMKVSEEEARALYWTNGNDLTKVLKLNSLQIPLELQLAAENKLKARHVSVDISSPELSSNKYVNLRPVELKHKIKITMRSIQSLQESQRQHKGRMTVTRVQDSANAIYELKQDLREIELALQAFQKLRRLPTSRRIDLHGCALEEAKVIAGEAIRSFMISGSNELEIVTGAGRHSRRGRSVIKEWLREYLRGINVQSKELDGSFVLVPKRNI